MKTTIACLLVLLLGMNSIFAQNPAIVMTTAITVGNSFSFRMSAEVDNKKVQVDFGDGNLINEIIGTDLTEIDGTLVGSQTVKVYGDGITNLVCRNDIWGYHGSDILTAIDISNNPALELLDCSTNQLTTLDLTKNAALIKLICGYNLLTYLDISNNVNLTYLDCGGNVLHNLITDKNLALSYLDCSYTNINMLDVSNNTMLTELRVYENQLTTLKISNNVALQNLDCSRNKLISLDISKNLALQKLRCEANQLVQIDVTSNTLLTDFSCGYNRISTLDLRKNTSLVELFCNDNRQEVLDISKNTALRYLYCDNNLLNVLNVTQNLALWLLNCGRNQLTTLDISKNSNLSYLDCYFNHITQMVINKNNALDEMDCALNQLTFATLLPKQSRWITYNYAPQRPIKIAKSLNVGIPFDLSNQLSVNGNTTVYTWKKLNGPNLVAGTDYLIANGRTTFLTLPQDSIFCEMANSTFPNLSGPYVLKTTNTKVTFRTPIDGKQSIDAKIYVVRNILYIQVYENSQLCVFEANGRLLGNKLIHSGTVKIRLQHSGMYWVQVTQKLNTLTKRINVGNGKQL